MRRRGANRAGIVKWIQRRRRGRAEENERRISSGGSGGHVRTRENIYIPIHVTAAHGRRKEEACMGHLRGRGTGMGEERGILSNKPILLRRASRVYPKGARGTWRTTRGFQPATLFTPSIPLRYPVTFPQRSLCLLLLDTRAILCDSLISGALML